MKKRVVPIDPLKDKYAEISLAVYKDQIAKVESWLENTKSFVTKGACISALSGARAIYAFYSRMTGLSYNELGEFHGCSYTNIRHLALKGERMMRHPIRGIEDLNEMQRAFESRMRSTVQVTKEDIETHNALIKHIYSRIDDIKPVKGK